MFKCHFFPASFSQQNISTFVPLSALFLDVMRGCDTALFWERFRFLGRFAFRFLEYVECQSCNQPRSFRHLFLFPLKRFRDFWSVLFWLCWMLTVLTLFLLSRDCRLILCPVKTQTSCIKIHSTATPFLSNERRSQYGLLKRFQLRCNKPRAHKSKK